MTQSADNVITFTMSFDVNSILAQMRRMAEKKDQYLNVFKCDGLPVARLAASGLARYEHKQDATSGGLRWIEADEIMVPYNDEVMRRCISESISEIIELSRSSVIHRYDIEGRVADKAFSKYWDSEYYKTTFMRLSKEWSEKCKELFSPPEILKEAKNTEERLNERVNKLEDTVRGAHYSMNEIIDSLPVSVSKRLREKLIDVQTILADARVPRVPTLFDL